MNIHSSKNNLYPHHGFQILPNSGRVGARGGGCRKTEQESDFCRMTSAIITCTHDTSAVFLQSPLPWLTQVAVHMRCNDNIKHGIKSRRICGGIPNATKMWAKLRKCESSYIKVCFDWCIIPHTAVCKHYVSIRRHTAENQYTIPTYNMAALTNIFQTERRHCHHMHMLIS